MYIRKSIKVEVFKSIRNIEACTNIRINWYNAGQHEGDFISFKHIKEMYVGNV